MPDFWFDVDAALTEVPVNLLPLVDDTDGKAIEAAVAYNAAGLALFWHFVTTAGVYNNGVAVTPTTGGAYDWTDHGTHGIYTIEIPASGGASANNDTEGFGWFTGVATGILPWRGPTIGFRAAALNDALIDGGDTLDVNVTAMAANVVTATAINADAITEAKIADAALSTEHIAAALYTRLGIIAYGTAQTNADTSKIILASATSIADDMVNNAVVFIASGTGAGQSSMIRDWVSSTDTATVDPPWTTAPTNDSGYVVYAAAGAATTAIPGVNVIQAAGTAWGSGAITAASLAADAGAEIADAVLNRDMSTGTDSGSATVRTLRQAVRFLRNKWSISGTTLTVTKEDDTTASWTTEVTTSAAAEPVTGSDPASS